MHEGKPRTNGLFVRPTQLKSFADGETTGVIKQIFGEPEQGKRYSRIGYEGDILYVCEPGKFIKDGSAYIYVRQDDTAVKSESHTIKEIKREGYAASEGEIFLPESMPTWAARYLFQIKWVSYPIHIQDLSDAQIMSLGIRIDKVEGNMCHAHCGEEKYQFVSVGKRNLKEAMKMMWNYNFGSFKKSGTDFISYRYDNEPFEMPNDRITKLKGFSYKVYHNPFITYYELEIR